MKIFLPSHVSSRSLSASSALANKPRNHWPMRNCRRCCRFTKTFTRIPSSPGTRKRSSAIVAKELRAAGCEVTENFGKYDKPNLKCYGVVGVMKNGDGPTVLVRSDMDALPVHEETGLPYASTVTTKNDDGKEVSSHARLRTRRSHVGVHRHGARAWKAEGSMAWHNHFRRPTGRGSDRRRACDAEGRTLHAFGQSRLRARLCTTTPRCRPARSESPTATLTRTSIQ